MRVLSKARDFYIRSMSECAGQVGFGASMGMGCPTPHISSLPRSFSVGSTSSSYDQDFRELVRAASTRSLGGKVDLEFRQRQSPASGVNVVPRSQSVAVGRIDEDKPCEFGEDFKSLVVHKYLPYAMKDDDHLRPVTVSPSTIESLIHFLDEEQHITFHYIHIYGPDMYDY
ncbi:hypothetical protein RJ639_045207 [Escallonia herrerae]|uniref:Uncharacterized protein n=1 Tax=Escallonia herrerae TaxID=1293975 RepID=A0AA89B0P0_9ASTE|nr:hypothetical protein RJ639_045207 [Escallonia herrerae]